VIVGGLIGRDAALERVASLRREFTETAAELDRTGKFPTLNLKRLYDEGLAEILVPKFLGGSASDSGTTADLDILSEIITEIGAGESSTAQIWGVHTVVSRLIFSNLLNVPRDVKEKLAYEVLNEGARFSNSSAEGGKRRRAFETSAVRRGDAFVVNGVKLFNTGSEGAKYTIAPVISDDIDGGGLVYVLIPMSASGVIFHNDWDNMGQRGTASGTLTFNNVTVPERFHFSINGGPEAFSGPSSIFGLFFQTAINASILGIGFGAFESMCEHVRQWARPNLSTIDRAVEDPLNQWHAGRLSSQLAGARALQREASLQIWDVERASGRRPDASVQMMRAKFAINEAVLEACGQLHRLAGGRATSNKYRLDRFWRNARTLTVHDSIDVKLQQIGAFELEGTHPLPSMIS
jgi:alkylation response protein AidB-like acyl-CoA dehydrogenase